MKNLLVFYLFLIAFTASSQRFILKDGDDWSYKPYPRSDYGAIESLEGGLVWYADSIGSIPVHDSRLFYVVDTTIFTNDYHHIYTNVLKAVTTYSLKQLPDLVILRNIDQSTDDHINNDYSVRDAVANIYRYIELDITPGNPPTERAEIDSLFEILDWQDSTRNRGREKKDSLLNHSILPDFNYPLTPIE